MGEGTLNLWPQFCLVFGGCIQGSLKEISVITAGGENPLHLWALWGVETLEAEATWQGCALCIWLILPLASATHPFLLTFFPFGRSYSLYLIRLPLVLLPLFWDFGFCVWCFSGVLFGLLALLPWALCTPYISFHQLAYICVPFPTALVYSFSSPTFSLPICIPPLTDIVAFVWHPSLSL